MSPDLLQQAGILLFGEGWKKPLADALDVHERTMHRWAKGEFRIPPSIASELVGLLRSHNAQADQLISRLSA